jgi:transcription initiation factor TFIIIB Brf1 subunit/transcription initiation factor TFIIB
MNTVLLKLFEQYELREKDRYEIAQVYNFLSEEKKQNLIKNFKVFIQKIKKFREQLQKEKEILVGETIEEIKIVIEQVKRTKSL